MLLTFYELNPNRFTSDIVYRTYKHGKLPQRSIDHILLKIFYILTFMINIYIYNDILITTVLHKSPVEIDRRTEYDLWTI